MLFPEQIARRLIVKSAEGSIVITVSGGPEIQFRTDPDSAQPDFRIETAANVLEISSDLAEIDMYTSGTSFDAAMTFRSKVSPNLGFGVDKTTGIIKALESPSSSFEEWNAITSFSNGWTADVPAPQYYRDPTGQIHLRGRLVPGTTANGTVMCTMPVRYRPPQTYFVPATQDNAPYNQPAVEVQADGDVTIWSWTAGIVVLDAVKFHVF